MKSDQIIPQIEIIVTRLALREAMQAVAVTGQCDWLSSRQYPLTPGRAVCDLTEICGGAAGTTGRKQQREPKMGK